MSDLRLESVYVENIRGINGRIDFNVGTLTVLRGDNGTGKTSIIQAIRAVFEGGHDATLLHNGAEVGRVELRLSNGITIVKRIAAKTSGLEIRTADGSIVPKPATFVERLATGFAYDPIAFLDADKKKRTKFLLEAMPISFQPEEVEAAGGGKPASVLNIETFESYRAGIYEKRRQLNVIAKQNHDTFQSLKKQLKEMGIDADVDHRQILSGLQERLGSLRADRLAIVQKVEADAATARANARADYEAKLAQIAKEEATAVSEQTIEVTAAITQVQSDIARVDEKAKAQTSADGTRQSIKQFEDLWGDAEFEAEQLTTKLSALDALKKKKLSNAAIPGIDIRDGEIFVDDVALDALNTQRQYFAAFQIAALNPGGLGFMVCDRVESVVGEQWEQFCAAAKESGFQVMVARAEAGQPLTVEADDITPHIVSGRAN